MTESTGWNLDTLKVYVDSRLDSQERAVGVALTAAKDSAESLATGVAAKLSSEVSRISGDIGTLNDTMQALKDVVVEMQGRKIGIAISGKVLTIVLSSLAGVAIAVGFVYRILFR